MVSILLLGVLGLLGSSMAIENGGKWMGVRKINPFSETYEKLYRKMRETSVRFLVRHHYHTLKNEKVRHQIQVLISKYYESIYHYYKLSEEDRDFIDSVTSLLM